MSASFRRKMTMTVGEGMTTAVTSTEGMGMTAAGMTTTGVIIGLMATGKDIMLRRRLSMHRLQRRASVSFCHFTAKGIGSRRLPRVPSELIWAPSPVNAFVSCRTEPPGRNVRAKSELNEATPRDESRGFSPLAFPVPTLGRTGMCQMTL